MLKSHIHSLLALFNVQNENVDNRETLTLFQLNISNSELTIPSSDDLLNVLRQLQVVGDIKIAINTQNQNDFVLSYQREYADSEIIVEAEISYLNYTTQHLTNVQSFITVLNESKEDANPFNEINIEIIKKPFNKGFIVVSLDLLGELLSTRTLDQLIVLLSEQLQEDALILYTDEIEDLNHTSSIYFAPLEKDIHTLDISRAKRIHTIINTVHFSYNQKLQLIPEDFLFTKPVEAILQSIDNTFKKLAFILLVISIYDYTDIKNNTLTYKLNGYKVFNGELDFNFNISSDIVEDYYKIYNWIYSSINHTEKLGLAKNIISLHIKNSTIESFNGNVYDSVISSHKIYEKENIKQYIDVRNKISDQLFNFNKRANQIVETFAASFHKSVLSLVTLYASIIVIKLLNQKNSEISRHNILFILLGFCFVSLVILVYVTQDVKSLKGKFIKDYNNLKNRYTDLLTERDINKILNNDTEFKENISFINNKTRRYRILWILVLAIIIIFTLLYLYVSVEKHVVIVPIFSFATEKATYFI